MNLLRKIMQSALVGTVISTVAVFSVVAASPPPSVPAAPPSPSVTAKTSLAPNPGTNPILADLLKSGAKLYYLGKSSDLDGWLIIKDGQFKIVYVPAKGQNVLLIGGLFGADGEDITSEQMEILLNANPDLQAVMTASVLQTVMAQKEEMLATAAAQLPENLSLPAPVTPPTVLSSGERLYQDLSTAKGVTVSRNAAAPLILMVVDPDCPACHATWLQLRDFVFKGALQIRLIPINAKSKESGRAAAQLLRAADPLDAWNKYVDGDKSQLAGTPDEKLIAAAEANRALILSWNLHTVPDLVYRSKDGAVKIEKGESLQVTALLNDIAHP